MLDPVRRADAADYPLAELCQTAWACWAEVRRDLVAGDNIAQALLTPLRAEGVRVVRTPDGKSFAFRHDQMRGYLAAAWAARHEVTPIALFEATPGIWRLARTDQQVVWEFFAR